MNDYIAVIESKTAGIPCLLGVTHYRYTAPTTTCRALAVSPDEIDGDIELDYDILDRKGNTAEWLERKLDWRQRSKHEDAIIEYFANLPD